MRNVFWLLRPFVIAHVDVNVDVVIVDHDDAMHVVGHNHPCVDPHTPGVCATQTGVVQGLPLLLGDLPPRRDIEYLGAVVGTYGYKIRPWLSIIVAG